MIFKFYLIIPFFLIIFLPKIINNSIISNFSFKEYIKGAHSLFMLVVVVSTHNSTRFNTAYEVWMKKFPKRFPSSIITTGIRPHSLPGREFKMNFSQGIVSRSYKRDVPISQGHIFPFLTGMRYFYYNTTLRWMIRTTEDVYLDYDSFEKYLEVLENKYNPLTDLVVKGHLCVAGVSWAFLHGGSGWLISRAFAKAFIEKESIILEEFFKSKSGDDMVSTYFRSEFNISQKEIHSNAFIGSPFTDLAIKILEKQSFDLIPDCKSDCFKKSSEHHHLKLKDAVILHSGRKDLYSVVRGDYILKIIPNNIYLKPAGPQSNLCKHGKIEKNYKPYWSIE